MVVDHLKASAYKAMGKNDQAEALLRELAERANQQFASRSVNISVPSLRVDKMLQNIPWMVNSVRKNVVMASVTNCLSISEN